MYEPGGPHSFREPTSSRQSVWVPGMCGPSSFGAHPVTVTGCLQPVSSLQITDMGAAGSPEVSEPKSHI